MSDTDCKCVMMPGRFQGVELICDYCGRPVDGWQSSYNYARQETLVVAFCHGEMDVARIQDVFLFEAEKLVSARAFTTRRIEHDGTRRDSGNEATRDGVLGAYETHEHNPRGLVGYLPSAQSCRTPSKGGNNSEGE